MKDEDEDEDDILRAERVPLMMIVLFVVFCVIDAASRRGSHQASANLQPSTPPTLTRMRR